MARKDAADDRAYTDAELAYFEALVARYGRHVYNIAYRLSGSDADAKDLAQDAFVRVFRSLRRIDQTASLEGWLHRIVTNLYIDLLRTRPRRRVESLDAPLVTPQGGEVTREVPDPGAGPEEAVLRATLDGEVQRGLLRLSEDLRVVVVLCDIEGYSYEEIAAMLRVPLGTVKSRLHRARRVLAARLRPLRERGVLA